MVGKNVILSFVAALPWASSLSQGLGQRRTIGQVRREAETNALRKRDIDPSLLYPTHNFSVPVDHFHNESQYAPHTNATFNMRYWFDASHYQPGGPVIILQSGEADGVERLPFLQKGILAQLAQVTNGIGVVLEHRYYGASFPTPDLSIENLRFLTTEQALADEAYFARNIKFPGMDDCGDLTSKSTAYIGYGGSYAGAFNAFLRVQYPDIFWGTISSSGVTKAIYDYWQYYEPVAEYGPPQCIANVKTLTHVVDNILIGKNNSKLTATLQSAFGLGNLTHVQDFTSVLSEGVSGWQSLNWDPALSSPEFYQFCDNVTSPHVLYSGTKHLSSTVKHLISEGGYSPKASLVTAMLNYIGWVNETIVFPWSESGTTQDEYFSSYNATFYQQDGIDQYGWRSWDYQVCSEWGFLQTGSGVPKNQLPLISRTLDLEYESIVCRDAFNIFTPSDTEAVNKYGGYNISYPRLANIGGEWDPWRPATPLAFEYGALPRENTVDEPFILIPKAVHHWDENGLFPNQTTASLPPKTIVNTQKAEHEFVLEWMEEWKQYCAVVGGCS